MWIGNRLIAEMSSKGSSWINGIKCNQWNQINQKYRNVGIMYACFTGEEIKSDIQMSCVPLGLYVFAYKFMREYT